MVLFAMLTLSIASFAETYLYQTTKFAYAQVVNGTYYWGDWQQSSLNIMIDTDDGYIAINSPQRQLYKIHGYDNTTSDNQGGEYIKFYVIDNEGDKGTIRVRKDYNGKLQLYVDFNNVAWVYSMYQVRY